MALDLSNITTNRDGAYGYTNSWLINKNDDGTYEFFRSNRNGETTRISPIQGGSTQVKIWVEGGKLYFSMRDVIRYERSYGNMKNGELTCFNYTKSWGGEYIPIISA